MQSHNKAGAARPHNAPAMLRLLSSAAGRQPCPGSFRHLLCRAAAPAEGPLPASPRRRRRATTVSHRPQHQQLPSSQPTSASSFSTTTTSSNSSNSSSSSSSRKGRTRKGAIQAQSADEPAAAGASTAAVRQRSTAITASRASSTSNGNPSSSSSSSSSLFAPEPYVPGQDTAQAWVVFSDLHVNSKTLQPCLDVLRRVHEEARSRQAGVLFLGDFWDRRGDLPVIPLNSIQQEVSSWQDTPLLMLPGNHDMVDLQGQHHALHAVAVAAQSAHVFTNPTIYKGSLWLPYRRDEGLINAAIRAALAQGPLKAIFGHADVLTAHMNASYQARDGLPPELFPQRLPVYLGHYHFPHLVPGTSITYVGSPYQVTASEAGQQKRLLLLDTDWQQVDSIPINIGRKYYSLSTPAAAANAATSSSAASAAAAADRTSSNGSESDQDPALDAPAAEAAAAGVLQLDVEGIQRILSEGVLRPGDLVHVRADQEDGSEADVQRVAQALNEQGIQVQIHRAPSTRLSARIDAAEQLSMTQLLEVYAGNVGMPPEVLQAARDALKGLGGQSSAVPKHSHLELEEVTVDGFGPFAQAISYPLAGRGVVAVTGSNRDDAAAVSNGAGKTSLLTSLLWAFKAPDGRRMTNVDYINDTCKQARVAVTGRINGEPFELVRTAKKSKSSLTLMVGGQDITRQDQRLTEAELQSRFSASLLPRTLVFTQEDLLELLQYGDAAFKRMLGSVVDTECWEGAREAAASQGKALSKQAATAEGVISALESALQRLQVDLLHKQQQEREWEQRQEAEKERATHAELAGMQQLQAAATETQQALGVCAVFLQDLQKLQQSLQEAIAHVQEKVKTELAEGQSLAASSAAAPASTAAAPTAQQQQQQQLAMLPEFDSAAAEAALQPLIQAEQQASQQLQQQRGAVQDLQGQLKAAKARRIKYTGLQGASADAGSSSSKVGSAHGSSAGSRMQPVCEQCLQPINVELYQRNLGDMAAEEQQLHDQLAAATEVEQQLLAAEQAAAKQRKELQQQQMRQQQEVAAAREAVMQKRAAESKRQEEKAKQRLQEQQRQQREHQEWLNEFLKQERQLTQCANNVEKAISVVSAWQTDVTGTLTRLTQSRDITLATGGSSSSSSNSSSSGGDGSDGGDGGSDIPYFAQLFSASVQLTGSRPSATGAALMLGSSVQEYCTLMKSTLVECGDRLKQAFESVEDSRAKLERLAVMSNEHSAVVQQLQGQLARQQEELEQQKQEQQELAHKVGLWSKVEAAFGRTGIPSFLLEGVLGELQAATSRHLAHLAAGMTLELSSVSSRKAGSAAQGSRGKKGAAAAALGDAAAGPGSSGVSSSSSSSRQLASVAAGSVFSSSSRFGEEGSVASDSDDGEEEVSSAPRTVKAGRRKETGSAAATAFKEEISKIVRVQGAAGALMERSIAQLSGGEKKRVALALGLGFAEVVAARGRLTSNILVLDEVLEKLDDEGCSRVAWLLKGLPYDSVFVVGQAGSFVTKEFAAVDTVVKAGGSSYVELGGGVAAALSPAVEQSC